MQCRRAVRRCLPVREGHLNRRGSRGNGNAADAQPHSPTSTAGTLRICSDGGMGNVVLHLPTSAGTAGQMEWTLYSSPTTHASCRPCRYHLALHANAGLARATGSRAGSNSGNAIADGHRDHTSDLAEPMNELVHVSAPTRIPYCGRGVSTCTRCLPMRRQDRAVFFSRRDIVYGRS